MNAQPVTIMPLARPRFDNATLGNPELWAFYNARALGFWWRDLSIALGESPFSGLDTLEAWLGVQHDIEMALHGPVNRLPHGPGNL